MKEGDENVNYSDVLVMKRSSGKWLRNGFCSTEFKPFNADFRGGKCPGNPGFRVRGNACWNLETRAYCIVELMTICAVRHLTS